MSDIQKTLTQLANFGNVTHNPYRLVLDHGFQPKGFEELPEGMTLGEPKACFYNAFTRMTPELVYTEGYVLLFGMPINHAWLTNLETGKAIEVTLPNERRDAVEYFGIIFNHTFLIEMANRTGYAGVFANAFMAWDMFTGNWFETAIIKEVV
jgi:hypothetical protein